MPGAVRAVAACAGCVPCALVAVPGGRAPGRARPLPGCSPAVRGVPRLWGAPRRAGISPAPGEPWGAICQAVPTLLQRGRGAAASRRSGPHRLRGRPGWAEAGRYFYLIGLLCSFCAWHLQARTAQTTLHAGRSFGAAVFFSVAALYGLRFTESQRKGSKRAPGSALETVPAPRVKDLSVSTALGCSLPIKCRRSKASLRDLMFPIIYL